MLLLRLWSALWRVKCGTNLRQRQPESGAD